MTAEGGGDGSQLSALPTDLLRQTIEGDEQGGRALEAEGTAGLGIEQLDRGRR